MTHGGTPSRRKVVLAWLAVILAAAFIVLGVIWYGGTPGVRERIWHDLAERPGGPMTFRFVLQPLMAALVAFRDGIEDARLGRAPYFWTVLSDPAQRGLRLREGIIATARIYLLGLAVDVIYQHVVLGAFYPGEAVLVALALAVLPYFLLRGPAARVARLFPAIASGRKADRNGDGTS